MWWCLRQGTQGLCFTQFCLAISAYLGHFVIVINRIPGYAPTQMLLGVKAQYLFWICPVLPCSSCHKCSFPQLLCSLGCADHSSWGDARGRLDFCGGCWFFKTGAFCHISHPKGLSRGCISLSCFVSSSSCIAGFLAFVVRDNKSFILLIKEDRKVGLMKLRKVVSFLQHVVRVICVNWHCVTIARCSLQPLICQQINDWPGSACPFRNYEV